MNRPRTSRPESTSDADPDPTAAIAQIRLLHWMLVFGVTMFGVVAIVVVRQEWIERAELGSGLIELLPWVGLAMVVTLVPAAFVLRSALRARVPRGASMAVRIAGFRASALMFVGMGEGAVLLNLVAILVVSDPTMNVAAAALGWMVMLATAPTRESFDQLGR